ncbi:sialidase family protein [Adhaeribacter rhizoryzae]|uniref:Sialidase domain-containing protein n=1 Tax=Adhaeribacter rhizoryzae TaxID=2607907 RepID=A0A5M6DM35_9BACT|nr:sialidase family protein [Adhaeribacter rhizoryzae]KAA5547476.1 hypothetical protein F0145_09125 [Adhaeribacter rhizoryzae]
MQYLRTLLYITFIGLIFNSCQRPLKQAAPVAVRISSPNLKSSCPYLTQDHQGRPVLCWVQAQDTAGNFLMAYAVSLDGGQTFGNPKFIATTQGVHPHDENLSKILFRENGDIIAMFAVNNPNPENNYAGLVKYTQSFDGGKTWTAAKQIAEDAAASIDERYFDMTLLPNGEVAVIWLDSRKETPAEGSSLYYASTQGRAGFKHEKVIDQQLCQCCRTKLFVDATGNLHAVYRGIINGTVRDMMHLVSPDNGKSFSEPERISADNWAIDGCPHSGPAMTATNNNLHFVWYTMGGGSGVYYCRKPDKQGFSQREIVSNVPSAKHPQICTFNQEQLAIVWDEQTQQPNNLNNRIGLQIRDGKGQIIRNTHLTPDSISATHPVILKVAESAIIVAYTDKTTPNSQVWYKLITL